MAVSVDLGCKKYCRVHHGKNELYKTDKKIKKIILTELKNFWGTTNVRLCKLRSMDKRNSSGVTSYLLFIS